MRWLEAQSVSPYACATLGEGASVAATVVVSWLTPALPAAHLERVFPGRS